LDPGTRDFNLDLLYANETTVEKVLNIAGSFPMMAERRVIVVKDIQHFKPNELKHLASYTTQPSKTSTLILTLVSRKVSGKWFKQIIDHAWSINCRKLYDNEVPIWVEKYLRTQKMEIEKPAIQLLQAQVGNSLLNLVNELEKIQINIHPRRNITLADVQNVTSISKQYNIFELCNSVGEKKFSRSIAILNKLLEQGESPTGMVIQLTRHFVSLLKIKESIRQGKTAPNDLTAVTGLPYFFIKDMMAQARGFTSDQYHAMFHHLAEADLHLKTGYQTPGLVMELLLYRLIKG